MGEQAEMMLDGFLCECCGEVIDGEEPGYPRYCSPRCAKDRGAAWVPSPSPTRFNPSPPGQGRSRAARRRRVKRLKQKGEVAA